MSEALRLADWLDHHGEKASHADAAAELRRLHDLLGKSNALCRIRADRIKKLEALNAELVEGLRMSRDALNQMWQSDKARPALVVAERALAKAEASK